MIKRWWWCRLRGFRKTLLEGNAKHPVSRVVVLRGKVPLCCFQRWDPVRPHYKKFFSLSYSYCYYILSPFWFVRGSFVCLLQELKSSMCKFHRGATCGLITIVHINIGELLLAWGHGLSSRGDTIIFKHREINRYGSIFEILTWQLCNESCKKLRRLNFVIPSGWWNRLVSGRRAKSGQGSSSRSERSKDKREGSFRRAGLGLHLSCSFY